MDFIRIFGAVLWLVFSVNSNANQCSKLLEVGKKFNGIDFEIIENKDGFVMSSYAPSILIRCSSALDISLFGSKDFDENKILDVFESGRPVYVRISDAIPFYVSPDITKLQNLSTCEYFYKFPILYSGENSYYYEFIDEKTNTSISFLISTLDTAISFIGFLGIYNQIDVVGAVDRACQKTAKQQDRKQQGQALIKSKNLK